MEFSSPFTNINILFMILSVFPSLEFILALSNCIQTAIMCSLCMQGRGYGEAEQSCSQDKVQIYLNSCRREKSKNSSEQKKKTPLIYTLLPDIDELQVK